MDTWPTDSRTDEQHNTSGRKKGKGKTKEQILPSYPQLKHGSLGFVTLREKNDSLDWASLVNQNDQDHPRIHAIGEAVTIFPPTRPPPLHPPQISIKERVELGANFVRTYYPDVDIAAELIREELAQDAHHQQQREIFDPYMSNLLEPVYCYDRSRKRKALLAFPMGELNRELNLSPLRFSTNRLIFRPYATAVHTFSTPIQQIVASESQLEVTNREKSYLAVRTYGTTRIFDVKTARSSNKSIIPQLNELSEISSSDLGGRTPVDIKLRSASSQATLVTDRGAVYNYNLTQGNKVLHLLHPPVEVEPGSQPGSFWRIAYTGNGDQILLTSSKVANLIDCRTKKSATGVFTVQGSREMITCVEGPRIDHVTCLTTTNEILWVDDRFYGKPLLGYRHERSFDRTLEARTVTFHTTPLTFLSSRKNGLLTIYDISRGEDQLIHVNCLPYCLPIVVGSSMAHVGQTYFKHSGGSSDNDVSLLRLSERGSIHQLELEFQQFGQPRDTRSTKFEWSSEITALASQTQGISGNNNLFGFSNMDSIDLRPYYDDIFSSYSDKNEEDEERDAEMVYDLVERIPLFWQESDVPVDHVLTTYDVAFRTGEQPKEASRADFLTGCAVNSTRGYRALVQERLSSKSLAKQAKWHYNIGQTLKHFDVDIRDYPSVADDFCKYELAAHTAKSTKPLGRERAAREQLALDLALSMDVYSAQPFARLSRMDEMSRATEALTLDGEPPPVNYGYFRPVLKDESAENEELNPLGVRLLLREWQVGTDPQDYVYKDPYGNEPEDLPQPKKIAPIPTPAQSQARNQTTQPPTIVASSSVVPAVQRSQVVVPSWDGLVSSQQQSQSQSQEFITQTQVLPGPFGGRAVGKKAAKRRMGGF